MSRQIVPKIIGARMRYENVDKSKILSDTDLCPICYTEYKASSKVIILSKCQHMYHKRCLRKWYTTRKTCPIDGGRLD